MFITYMNPPRYRQLSFEELLSGVENLDALKWGDPTSTRTVIVPRCPAKLERITNYAYLYESLKSFNAFNKELIECATNNKMDVHYRHFNLRKRTYKPRRQGEDYQKWFDKNHRPIDAPDDELQNAQRNLKSILEGTMIASHHSAAYAYVEGRSTVKAVMKHQQWESRWFADFDFSKFFPSTNMEFVISMFRNIYPFEGIVRKYKDGEDVLRKALSICFLNGGLPQGTPISPFITNVMMIPFDHIMANKLHNFQFQNGRVDRLVYTRYADDICVSCRVGFRFKEIEAFIVNTLKELGAPFQLNTSKTHYGNRNGSNYRLGVIINRDNKITPGHEKMKHFKADLNNYVMDRTNGHPWPLEEVQRLSGNLSYLKSIYKATADDKSAETYVEYVVRHMGEKYNLDIKQAIREDLYPR